MKAEKEAEKGIARKDVEMTENASEKPSSKINDNLESAARNGDKARRKRNGKVLVDEDVKDEEQEDANSDGSDFWVPPAGDRWDFDTGCNDRWSVPSHNDPEYIKAVQINGDTEAVALVDDSNFDDGDTEMLDGAEDLHDSASSDDSDANTWTKRMSTAPVPRSQKKRAKRLKVESRK